MRCDTTLQVNVSTDSGSEKITDIYRQPVGLRTVRVTETQFLINEKPFYFHGVGKHEDANVCRYLVFPLY